MSFQIGKNSSYRYEFYEKTTSIKTGKNLRNIHFLVLVHHISIFLNENEIPEQWSQRWKRFGSVFVYSKSVYTLKSVSMSGRPSVRLHDNSRKTHPIVVKFLPQLYLINISVEFEDEPNWPRIYWVFARSILIFYSISNEANFWLHAESIKATPFDRA